MPDLNSPILTGDVSGGLHTTSVDKLKGSAVANTAPASGQVLTWNGSAWAPATPSTGGGGGANGLTYYLDFGTAADSPITNLPGAPKMLGRTGSAASSTYTSGTLTNGSWTLLAGFVSESTPQDPAVLVIPGGLWDFNVWALGTANQQSPTSIRAKVYTYDGSNAPTLIATSSEQIINTVSAQYSISALVAQTTITATTRIYVEIEARATANGHTATLQFGDGQPSHVHTSLPLVGGTGLWKNVSGVLQSPASLLVDADVDAAAAIAQSKIASLTTDLGNKAGSAQVDVYTTPGTYTWTKPAGAKSVSLMLFGGGGGGASGGKNASQAAARVGGGGGAGGGYFHVVVPSSALESTETVIVGAGGTAGAARSTDGAGITGGAGGNSQFANFRALGGVAGGGTGSGGAAVQASNNGGSASGTGSAGGGGVPSSLTVAFQPGGPGGGGGGGILAGTQTTSAGGGGGRNNVLNLAGGINGTVNNPGGNGAAAPTNYPTPGSGGGGGGASVTGNGGNGGAGGYPAAGGGGGGATETGAQSGAGGAGAAGMVVVTTYF